MMDKNDKSENIENIKQQIDEALKEIEKIKNETTKVRNAAELTRFEKQIAKTTDRLAGLLTAKAVQEALDSDEISQQSSELIKNMPGKMENQGQREVAIKPLRGGAFTVKTAYYTKKKKSKKKKKKR
jgi:anion-transporting  ArsA/GET3 family ATPase